jgi:hypothetical protein
MYGHFAVTPSKCCVPLGSSAAPNGDLHQPYFTLCLISLFLQEKFVKMVEEKFGTLVL